MSVFSQAVVKAVRSIPRGKVVSYGQVALMVGKPGAAREVGWILRQAQDKHLPWWRVINNQGRITIKNNIYYDANTQRDYLRAEAVEVGEDYSVDIAKYRWELTKFNT